MLLTFIFILCVVVLGLGVGGHRIHPSKPKHKLLPPEKVDQLERELGITVENRLANLYDENERWLIEANRILNPINPLKRTERQIAVCRGTKRYLSATCHRCDNKLQKAERLRSYWRGFADIV